MRIKLLSYTKDPLNTIYLAAKQCTEDGWVGDINPESISKEDKEKLISFCVKAGHTSVIEHVSFTFALDGISRSESHQHVRHRIASYSQQSQRYVQVRNLIDNIIIPETVNENKEAHSEFIECIDLIEKSYNSLINSYGIPAEDARYLLPNATATRLVFTMNCSSLLHFFSERCCTRAQDEIREVANSCLQICQDILPCIFKDAGPKCKKLGYCPEKKPCEKLKEVKNGK